jgi:hypothetical protein
MSKPASWTSKPSPPRRLSPWSSFASPAVRPATSPCPIMTKRCGRRSRPAGYNLSASARNAPTCWSTSSAATALASGWRPTPITIWRAASASPSPPMPRPRPSARLAAAGSAKPPAPAPGNYRNRRSSSSTKRTWSASSMSALTGWKGPNRKPLFRRSIACLHCHTSDDNPQYDYGKLSLYFELISLQTRRN